MKNSNATWYTVKSFMENVNKLTPGRRAISDELGIVKCIKAADHSRGYVESLKRSGQGTRLFTMSKSPVVPNGKYTLGKLRAKLNEAVA